MIHIVGDSHAPDTFRKAARHVGYPMCAMSQAELVMISQDCKTGENGTRELDAITFLVNAVLHEFQGPVVLTSQVPPGFTRQFLTQRLYHQSETLRIKDALVRAIVPEQHIVGCMNTDDPLPLPYMRWLHAFPAPIVKMTYEEAEFSKIAINMTLASQVENTNRLSTVASKLGLRWGVISNVLGRDKRIGFNSYLTPGRWQDSKHLMRDYVTLKEIEGG